MLRHWPERSVVAAAVLQHISVCGKHKIRGGIESSNGDCVGLQGCKELKRYVQYIRVTLHMHTNMHAQCEMAGWDTA